MKLLEEHRRKIDHIDDRVIDLLAERLDAVRVVAKIKAKNDIPAILPDRVEEVIARCAARGEGRKLSPELVRLLYTLIVDYCCAMEEEYISKS
ncbi:MAG TPA: chorismate mutase [Micavibrio sp.]|nr:chorismate mutase [Micavibrio sp.]